MIIFGHVGRWLRGRPVWSGNCYDPGDTLPRSSCDRCCPNIMLQLLQRRVCITLQHTFLILSGSCDCLGSETSAWISILRTRLLILLNTKRSFWSMWRMITVPNIDVCLSLNVKAYQATICSSPQCRPDLANLLMIHLIRPVMMKNTKCLYKWLKRHLDKAIVQHT